MCFLNTGGGYSVAVVTRCTAESLRIVNLQKLLAGMTGEGSFPSQVCLRQGQRFPDPQMTGLAPVD